MEGTAEIVVKKRAEDINAVKFTGHMIARRESTRCLMVFFRATTKQGARTYTNSMKLLSFDNELNTQINSIPLRTKVCLTGYVTSSKKKTEPAAAPVTENTTVGKTAARKNPDFESPVQYFVVTGIERLPEDAPDENQIEITGSVSRAFVTRGGSITFIVSTVRDGHYLKFIKATASPKLEVDFIKLMSSGTRIHIKGHCSAHTVITDGIQEHIETIVIDELCKV